MTETEIERIAAAINALRPDWPVPSLKTLMKSKLYARARRDVAVALAWVACDSDTKTPARVLESGPWWQAVVAEGPTGGHQHPARIHGLGEGDPREICVVCSLLREDCTRRAATNGHRFTPRSSAVLPPTAPGVFGERRKCLAGPPDEPCQLKTGHSGDHHHRTTDKPAETSEEQG